MRNFLKKIRIFFKVIVKLKEARLKEEGGIFDSCLSSKTNP